MTQTGIEPRSPRPLANIPPRSQWARWRDALLWTPSHGRAKAGRPARTYIQQLCADTGCSPEDLPEAMDDKECGERESEITVLIGWHDDDEEEDEFLLELNVYKWLLFYSFSTFYTSVSRLFLAWVRVTASLLKSAKTLLRNLTNLNYVVVWMISTRPLIS